MIMKPEELMIGDYITFSDVQNDDNCPKLKVIALNEVDVYVSVDGDPVADLCGPEDIAGIPLTPEILKKNGFEKLDFSHYHIKDRTLVLDADGKWKGPLSWHWVFTEMDTNAKGQPVVIDYYVATINYVHELQHALRLCRIEKEIIL